MSVSPTADSAGYLGSSTAKQQNTSMITFMKSQPKISRFISSLSMVRIVPYRPAAVVDCPVEVLVDGLGSTPPDTSH